MPHYGDSKLKTKVVWWAQVGISNGIHEWLTLMQVGDCWE